MDFVITQGYHDFGEIRNRIAGKVGLNKQRYERCEIEIELALTCLSNNILDAIFQPASSITYRPTQKNNYLKIN